MKPLLKVMLTLGLVFVTIFVLGRVLGILTVDNVKAWLTTAQEIDVMWLIAAIIILLCLDIFLSVPTLATALLAGFFLGFPLGALTSFIGMSLALLAGYTISRRWGDRGIRLLIKDKDELNELRSTFQKFSTPMIILSRAAPMVPEIASCLAGATKMPLLRFCGLVTLGTAPYAMIAAFAGSISSIENPQPAIYSALAQYAALWCCWFVFQRWSKA